jgi:futalosine hydrolase
VSKTDQLLDWHKLVTMPARLPSVSVLVVAATELELEKVEGADTLCCGIGPVEAAIVTAAALAVAKPSALLHIGIAGARRLEPGRLAIGVEALYCDLRDPGSRIERIERVEPDPLLLAAARAALPDAAAVPIATAARVGDGHACAEVEAMEGFAVLRAAKVAGVPALELRAVSNAFDAPRAEWRVDEAVGALADAVPRLIEAFGA